MSDLIEEAGLRGKTRVFAEPRRGGQKAGLFAGGNR